MMRDTKRTSGESGVEVSAIRTASALIGWTLGSEANTFLRCYVCERSGRDCSVTRATGDPGRVVLTRGARGTVIMTNPVDGRSE
jgi:hypothetical protein